MKHRAAVSVKLGSASDGALVMAYFNGKLSSPETPDGLKVSFRSQDSEDLAAMPKNWIAVAKDVKFADVD